MNSKLMNWLKKLFGTETEFVGDFIKTGEELIDLTHSNQIVAAELGQFKNHARELESKKGIKAEAKKSANALSGYGISVSSRAFIETLEM